MPQIYAEVGSITMATRLSKELSAQKIKAEVIHTPNSTSGCSYSVKTDEKYKDILTKYTARYKIKRIIKSDSDGFYDIS
ncbi:MAG: DUF3343 domain-containing protein [Clostridia bacterium]|nr:DUF3343 domain-containing protein [Clostridia bacterium]